MALGPFLLFAGEPGERLPDMSTLKVAKHSKGDANGVKKDRPNLRVVPKARFKSVATIEELYRALFGAPKDQPH